MRASASVGTGKVVGAMVLAWVFLAFGAFPSHGAPANARQAQQAVSGWLKTPGHGLGAAMGRTLQKTELFADGSGRAIYYVVSLQPSGFVVVSTDDQIEPIVAFSPTGQYVASADNPLTQLLARDLPGRLTMRQEVPGHAMLSHARGKWQQLQATADTGGLALLSAVTDVRVSPLVQSRWSQGSVGSGYCYNYFVPNHYVCGCVATAMAQLMRYHQWPTAGVGTASFTIYVDGAAQTAALRGGNGTGGAYDWANMPLAPGSTMTDAQRQAIGALCYDAGVSVHMQYASGGSGAYPRDASTALKSVFRYSNSVLGGTGSDMGSSYVAMINANLDAGYPTLLSIYATSGAGHEIVADGYGYDAATPYHHLNFGWAGGSDAWYNLPHFSAGGYSWNVLAYCIYNVYVSGSGEIVSGRVLDGSGQPVSGATVTATRAAGGAYTATTNSRGIYALVKVPSASTYTLNVAAAGCAFTPATVQTGTSADRSTVTGNVWGVNFTAATGSTTTTSALPTTTAAAPTTTTAAPTTTTVASTTTTPVSTTTRPPTSSTTTAPASTTTTTLPGAECIIDNTNNPAGRLFQVLRGTWGAAGSLPTRYGIDSRYAYVSPVGETARVRWSTNTLPAGSYAVYAWWASHPNRSQRVPYTVKDGAKELLTIRVNQTVNGGQWMYLGTFAFSAGGHAVEMANGQTKFLGSEQYVSADAVRFVRTTAGRR